MIANVFKYRSNNLIIFYYYTYSRLLGTMELIRNAEFGPWING